MVQRRRWFCDRIETNRQGSHFHLRTASSLASWNFRAVRIAARLQRRCRLQQRKGKTPNDFHLRLVSGFLIADRIPRTQSTIVNISPALTDWLIVSHLATMTFRLGAYSKISTRPKSRMSRWRLSDHPLGEMTKAKSGRITFA